MVLAHRFYLGELPDGAGGWLPGKHGALVDPAQFERAQAMRNRNTHRPRRVSTVRTPWALSGVATCGDCGEPLVLFGAGPRRRVQCSGRRQGNGYQAPTFFVETVEDQVGGLLEGFGAPVEAQGRLLAAWRVGRSCHFDANAERLRLRAKFARLSELYVEGAIERSAYDAQRGAALAQLAGLPADTDPTDDAGRVLAEYLGNVGRAWGEATADERNRIARQLFADVLVVNKTAVAVMPRPEFRPFLELAGTDPQVREDLSTVMSLRRKRRGSVALPRHDVGVVVIAEAPRRPLSGRSKRAAYHTPRRRKLSPEQEAVIRAAAGTRSLRELAAEFGVSHETIRAVARR